jgi:hypothetical protein
VSKGELLYIYAKIAGTKRRRKNKIVTIYIPTIFQDFCNNCDLVIPRI